MIVSKFWSILRNMDQIAKTNTAFSTSLIGKRLAAFFTSLIFGLISSLMLSACQAASQSEQSTPANSIAAKSLTKAERGERTEVTIIGMIHGGHRTSGKYPLSLVETVTRTINPDIILTEIPPDRIDAALASYEDTGTVKEQRTRAFPEYTDVIIPLRAELGYTIKGTAAWTSDIASTRRAALGRIKQNPKRADQWQEWQQAQKTFSATLNGRGDDPLYIHSKDYDRAVEARYQPYMRYFEEDIGKGGWQNINRAHWANIASELDTIKGQGKRVLITYGGFHKYWFLRELEKRDDIIITPALPYFQAAN